MVIDYLHNMRTDDMDYPTMQIVYNLIRRRQPIDHVIRHYKETYFRELIWTLEDRAWQMMVKDQG